MFLEMHTMLFVINSTVLEAKSLSDWGKHIVGQFGLLHVLCLQIFLKYDSIDTD